MNIDTSAYLAEIESDTLADELEARGYLIFNDMTHLANELSDDEVITEYSERGLQAFNEVEDAIEYVQNKGYSVYLTNEIEDIWHDIYTHALTLDREKFMLWLNGQFIMHIERWI